SEIIYRRIPKPQLSSCLNCKPRSDAVKRSSCFAISGINEEIREAHQNNAAERKPTSVLAGHVDPAADLLPFTPRRFPSVGHPLRAFSVRFRGAATDLPAAARHPALLASSLSIPSFGLAASPQPFRLPSSPTGDPIRLAPAASLRAIVALPAFSSATQYSVYSVSAIFAVAAADPVIELYLDSACRRGSRGRGGDPPAAQLYLRLLLEKEAPATAAATLLRSSPTASTGKKSSGGSGSNYSGSEAPLPPPSPGVALGLSKSTFTYEELALATDGFSDANLLGQGGFGYVHRGVLPNGNEVAIKQLKTGSGQGEREFHAEVEIITPYLHEDSDTKLMIETKQIVRALEGDVSLEDLNDGIRPGHSRLYSSYGSSDYDSGQYNEDMKRFRKMALTTQEYASSDYSAPTSQYAQNPSASSGEDQHTQETDTGKKERPPWF
ncbi:hypothetical protein BHE74_00013661, partial [Ensete ventricosum]